tara:strand:- start:3783 stop:4382 length:600 start_codon:yes stop_codon:yes gene_type:complete
MLNKENIIPYDFKVNKNLRAIKLNQIPKLIWFTGLSGSGKSTLSDALENKLFNSGFHTYSLDGDNVRTGISNNLSFSEVDRKENIRRISEVSKLMLDAGLIVLASFVSPLNEIRNQIKEIIGEKEYLEIYVSTPIEECERRDVKGLYKKARDGKIPNFTGISSPFEKPNNPFLSIDTTNKELEYCINIVYNEILKEIKK